MRKGKPTSGRKESETTPPADLEQRLPGPIAGIGDIFLDLGGAARFFDVTKLDTKLAQFVKYIVAKTALSDELKKLEEKVKDLSLTPGQKDQLLRRIKRIIKFVETCSLEDLLEAIDESDPSKIEELPVGAFRDQLSAAYEFARLIYLKRYHDTHTPLAPVDFKFEEDKCKLTVTLGPGRASFVYKCDPSKAKDAASFVKDLQEDLNACKYSTYKDGEKWRDLFRPAPE